MRTEFDQVAHTYDQTFTYTVVGKRQRARVWQYLENILTPEMQILELNGGTGEDAQFLARKNCEVLLTDVSTEMLRVAQEKCGRSIQVRHLDLTQLEKINLDTKFDLIFSNFGGLNCLSKQAMKELDAFARRHLKEAGELIFVIMPQRNMIDALYRKFKNLPPLKRSASVPIDVNVGEDTFSTYYHNPKDLSLYLDNFELLHTIPVGFIPSFLSSFISKNGIAARLLNAFDTLLLSLQVLSSRADHFLIHYEMKS